MTTSPAASTAINPPRPPTRPTSSSTARRLPPDPSGGRRRRQRPVTITAHGPHGSVVRRGRCGGGIGQARAGLLLRQASPLALGDEARGVHLRRAAGRGVSVGRRADHQHLRRVQQRMSRHDRMLGAGDRRDRPGGPIRSAHQGRAHLHGAVRAERGSVAGVEQRKGLHHHDGHPDRVDGSPPGLDLRRSGLERRLERSAAAGLALVQIATEVPRAGMDHHHWSRHDWPRDGPRTSFGATGAPRGDEQALMRPHATPTGRPG